VDTVEDKKVFHLLCNEHRFLVRPACVLLSLFKEEQAYDAYRHVCFPKVTTCDETCWEYNVSRDQTNFLSLILDYR
jgi:hypothetical protein